MGITWKESGANWWLPEENSKRLWGDEFDRVGVGCGLA